jgi:protein-disulfide isomerase
MKFHAPLTRGQSVSWTYPLPVSMNRLRVRRLTQSIAIHEAEGASRDETIARLQRTCEEMETKLCRIQELSAGKQNCSGRANWSRIMYRYCVINLIAIVSIIGMSFAGVAQESKDNIQKDIEELRQGQQAIRKDLQEIKAVLAPLMARQAPAVNVKGMQIQLGNFPIKGSETAKLVLIEFSDYQCPHCSKYTSETLPQIIKHYVDSGKMQYAIVDAPIPSHKSAPKAAEASHCAGEQGKYWEMHSQMMSQPDKITDLSFHATALVLNVNQFENCLKTDKYAEEVRKGMSFATKLGISGVPQFIIAQIESIKPFKAKGINLLRGALPFVVLQREIDQALADIGEGSPHELKIPPGQR